ncbi:hypothetical protein BH09PAT2_BH09PAT2_03250 [soil metagenome]
MNKIKILIIGLAIIIIVLIVGMVLVYQQYEVVMNEKMQTSAMLAQEQQIPTLPPGAVKLSECVPYEGEHWVLPKDLPYGPFYSTYNGKLISTEYMFTEEEIPGKEGSKMSYEDTLKFMRAKNLTFGDIVKSSLFGFDMFGHKYKTFDIHWSAPHAGLAVPHFDAHFFLVDKAEQQKICPDAKIENVYSEEIMKSIDEHDIPFPGKTTPTPILTKPLMQPSAQPTN